MGSSKIKQNQLTAAWAEEAGDVLFMTSQVGFQSPPKFGVRGFQVTMQVRVEQNVFNIEFRHHLIQIHSSSL